MRSFGLIAAAPLVFIAVSGCNQSPAPAQADAADKGATSAAPLAPGTVVVDLDAVAKALDMDDAMAAQLRQFSQGISNQVSEYAKQLQADIDAKQAEFGEEASDDQKKELIELAQEARRKFATAQQQGRMSIGQARNRLLSQFRAQVGKIAGEIALDRGATRVVSASALVLWYDPGTDITGEVIDRIRQMRAQAKANPAPAPAPKATESENGSEEN